MSKCELSVKVLQIANFSQITHSPTFGRAEKNKGALQASESAIRVPIYHMFCQLSNSLLGSLENIEKNICTCL